MELFSQLKKLAEKVKTTKEAAANEAATKNYFIQPFFELLGYDFQNPKEIAHEFSAGFHNN